MKPKPTLQELKRAVSGCGASILYRPLRNEVDYADTTFPLEILQNNIVLPTDIDSDPFTWAGKVRSLYENMGSYVLIPGSQFDIFGTRHGKGGGWYDRFLSKIPPEWPRIGIAFVSQLSSNMIPRQPRDETVDWILIKDGCIWKTYKTNSRSYTN